MRIFVLLAVALVAGCAGVSTRAVYQDARGVEAVLAAPMAECYEAALSALARRGFEVTAAHPGSGRIEALRMREERGLAARVSLFPAGAERTRVLVVVERAGSFELASRGEAPLIINALRAELEAGSM